MWNTTATTTSITTVTAGTYTVTATNASGCTATASGIVTVHTNPTAYAGDDTFVNFVTNVILGDSAPIGGTPPYTFAWTPGKGLSDSTTQFPVCTPLATTKYYLTVTDSNGCIGRDSVWVSFNKGNNALTDIVYSARNLAYTNSGQYLEFDLFASDTPTNLLFSQGQIYLTYDTTYFGANLIGSGAITVTKGQAIDSPYYNLSVVDSTRNMMKLSITHTANPASLTNLDSVNQQLCHFKFRVASVGTPFVNFDSVLMVGQSLYRRTASSLEFPYDLVQVRGLVGGLRSGELAYDLTGFSTTISSGSLAFYVTVQSSPISSFSDGQILIDYDTLAFGSSIASTASYYLNSSNDAVSLSDYSPSQLLITINNVTSQTTFDQIGFTPDSLLLLYFPILDCKQIAGVSIDQGTDTLISDYYDPSVPGTVTYAPIDAYYGSDYNLICPDLNPKVTGISTDCPNAGSFEVLSIYGEKFGTDTGTVYFNSANNPGTFISTLPQDIRSWSDNQIDLLIPSDPFGIGIAASGQFYVKTAAGLTDSTDNATISIGYANLNKRGSDNYARFVYLRDTPYIFQLDSFFFYTPDARGTIVHIISEFNCYMGLNFQVDTTAPSAVDTPSATDHINLISLQPYSPRLFTNTTVLAFTDFSGRIDNCNNGLDAYNDWADNLIETDISINATPPAGRTWRWGYSFSTNPTGSQYDFATVLAHEMGHAAMLCHTQPQTGFNIMYPITNPGQNNFDYSPDPDDILGVQHVLSLGQVLAVSGCPAAEVPIVFCTGNPPFVCTPRISSNISGIVPVKEPTFNAILYPNPYQQNTILHIDDSQYGIFSIRVYDVIGHLIGVKNVSGDGSFDIPLSDFEYSSGLYLIQVSDSNNSITLKMIKL